jgi:hypothetical protein
VEMASSTSDAIASAPLPRIVYCSGTELIMY